MSLDFDAAYARSLDKPAFSNSTEGEAWMSNWCAQCLRDAPHRDMGTGSGCPLVLVALMGRTPVEWFENRKFSLGEQYRCLEYRPRGGGGDPQPRPKPEPDQDGLFARPPRTVRMPVLPAEQPAEPVESRDEQHQ